MQCYFLVRLIAYIILKYKMNYPGGKKPRKFPFSGYTLICCICLDSGSKFVYILNIFDMFDTYTLKVFLSFSFFCFHMHVFMCLGVGVGRYFYYHFFVIWQTSYSSKLYWCHFLNENLPRSQNPSAILLMCHTIL